MPHYEIDAESYQFKPFMKIGEEWMLITAGDEDRHNAMTASWGGIGYLWGKCVSFIFVRPQRYTLEFIENSEYFSLSFFGDNQCRKELEFFGTKSGRDFDKPKETGLTPVLDEKAPYYEEAELVFICKKLYRQDLIEGVFLDKTIPDVCYPNKDYHRLFVGEIVKTLVK